MPSRLQSIVLDAHVYVSATVCQDGDLLSVDVDDDLGTRCWKTEEVAPSPLGQQVDGQHVAPGERRTVRMTLLFRSGTRGTGEDDSAQHAHMGGRSVTAISDHALHPTASAQRGVEAPVKGILDSGSDERPVRHVLEITGSGFVVGRWAGEPVCRSSPNSSSGCPSCRNPVLWVLP